MGHAGQNRKPDSERAALKALVTIYGPREAARISGLPVNSVLGWSARFKWKKVELKRDLSKLPMGGKDAADALKESLEKSRDLSTLHLAKYTEKASKKAAEHKNPLEVARKVRDVAGVYQTLWPAEEESQLIEGNILLGLEKPVLDVAEIEEAKALDSGHVRVKVPDQRPAGD